MKTSKLSDIVGIVAIIAISYSIIDLLKEVKESINDTDIIEYQYKDFTHKDIELAMKYHGIKSCTIKEGEEPFFIDKKGREIILFTDSCIESLIKSKQWGLKWSS